MLLSLITPTHRPAYLEDAYTSLLSQTVTDFEWVILPSNINENEIPARIRNDPRVRIMQPTDERRVGALKRQAFMAATGDVLIEFDHDDMLTADCLARIQYLASNGAGFIYSDDAVFQDDGVSWGYSKQYNWRHYMIRVYGRPLIATRCFPISPRMLCEVYFAPDHVRAWTRRAYNLVGGHDATLPVGDDHDLICRTYIRGIPFGYTNSCCYLYRYHKTNTVKEKSALIRQVQTTSRVKYLFNLAMEWSRRNKHVIVDLGTAPTPAGNIGVCVTKEPGTAADIWDKMSPGGLLRCLWFDGEKPTLDPARWDTVHSLNTETKFGPATITDAIALRGQVTPYRLA